MRCACTTTSRMLAHRDNDARPVMPTIFIDFAKRGSREKARPSLGQLPPCSSAVLRDTDPIGADWSRSHEELFGVSRKFSFSTGYNLQPPLSLSFAKAAATPPLKESPRS